MASKSLGACLAWFLAFGRPDLLDSWLCAFGTQPVYHAKVSVMHLSAMHISMMCKKKDVFDGPSVFIFIVLLSLFGHLGHVNDTVREGRVWKKKRDH